MNNDQALRNAQHEWDAQVPEFDTEEDEAPCVASGYHVFRPFGTKCKHCGADRWDEEYYD